LPPRDHVDVIRNILVRNIIDACKDKNEKDKKADMKSFNDKFNKVFSKIKEQLEKDKSQEKKDDVDETSLTGKTTESQ
jgi:hypothetical protein